MFEIPKNSGFHNKIAIACGVIFFLLLVVLGLAISGSISIAQPQYEQMIIFSLFIGISTGHFIGMAMTKSISRIYYFLIGLFSSLFLFSLVIPLIFAIIIIYIPLTLVLSSLFVFLAHLSKIIEEHRKIEELIDILGKYGTGAILGASGLIYYLIPFLTKLLGA